MIKTKRSPFLKTTTNENGSLAIDFIFAFTLIFGFTIILFSFALTLSAVSMTQYLTYSSARAYFAGNFTKGQQSAAASEKFEQLLATEGYSFLNRSSWFLIGNRFIGNINDYPTNDLSGYLPGGNNPNRFEGVVVDFIARILSYSSPFFGSTDPDGDGSGNTFSTRIGSYLGRESTVEECQQFMKQRWKYIRNLSVAGGGASYSTGTKEDDYTWISDNGC